MKAKLPTNEANRLKELHDLAVLDTASEPAFDNLTKFASEICGTPIALISLVDAERQWFKSSVGLDISETPRDQAFCAHAILSTEVLQVHDATKDDRFSDNPLVTGDPRIRFYAGVPLVLSNGAVVGTLCTIDRKPRTLTEAQLELLKGLAREAVLHLELKQKIGQLKTAYAHSIQSELATNSVLDNVSVMVWTSGPDKRAKYFNAQWLEFVGRTLEHEVTADWTAAVHPEDIQRCCEVYQSAFDRRQPFKLTYRLRRADGAFRFVEGVGQPWYDVGDEFVGYVGSCLDVHDDLATKDALKISQERFELAVNGSADGIWDWMIATDEAYFSPRGIEILGLSNDELSGKFEALLSKVDPQDREELKTQLDSHLRTGAEFETEVRVVTKHQTSRWIRLRGLAVWAVDGTPLRMCGSLRDVTEARSDKQKLLETSERLELANSGSNDGLWDWPDVTQDAEWWSPAFYELLGYKPFEIPATFTTFKTLLHPDDFERTQMAVEASFTYGEPFNLEYRLRTKDGVYRWYLGRARLTRDSSGAAKRMAGSISDVTARRLAQEETLKALKKAETAARTKSDFLANMSHEIRTPLTAILGYSETLQDDGLDKAKRDDAIQIIATNGNHLLGIINDILDLSKFEAGALALDPIEASPFAILLEVEQLMGMRAKDKRIELNFSYRWPIPKTVMLDPLRFKQILINLVGNAIKFTDKGSVNVTTCLDQKNKNLEVSVSDSGIGMDSEELQRLFKPFSQTDSSTSRRFGGTGLGLSISDRLVRMMGGEISVTSVKGNGATFTVRIPLSRPIASGELVSELPSRLKPVVQPPALSNLSPLKGRVLLAEDVAVNRALVASILSKVGVELTMVTNGQEAIDAISAVNFDLILMDMQMPVLDGTEATRRLRGLGVTVPIVALTGNVMSEFVAQCMAGGCDDFVEKPFTRERLLDVVRKYLSRE